ncbi:MAG: hypothetical protein JRN22_02205 [Nitrososphaerota archaeon]|nr:hypothetical protein [Nitrososphaerota archaeon]
MNCPKCKKETSLQTKRTLADGRRVRREKYCPKCHTRLYTVEMFQEDDEARIAKYHSQLRELSDKALAAEEHYKNLQSHIKAVLDHVKSPS